MNASRCRSVRRDHKAAKRRRRVVLFKERQVIGRRLAEAVRVNVDGPILGRRRPVLEMAERTRATGHCGMATVAKVVARSGLAAEIDVRAITHAQQRTVGLLVGEPPGRVGALQLAVQRRSRTERVLPALQLLHQRRVSLAVADAPP